MPLPVHSSSTTDSRWMGACGVEPEARRPLHGAEDGGQPALHVGRAAPVEPPVLAEPAERIAIRPTARAAPGSPRRCVRSGSSDGRPSATSGIPGGHHVPLPVDVPIERRGRGCARRASASIGTSTGSRPSSRRTPRTIRLAGLLLAEHRRGLDQARQHVGHPRRPRRRSHPGSARPPGRSPPRDRACGVGISPRPSNARSGGVSRSVVSRLPP